MAASRLVILGVAVTAAGGAGWVAKNMSAPPPAEIIDQRLNEPAIALAEVLVLSKDVPMGAGLADSLDWQQWPASGVNEHFIARDTEPDALEKLSTGIARVPFMPASQYAARSS